MGPQRNIFRDGANYGFPLAPRISDSMPSGCSFDIPSIGAATLDSTVGSPRQAISRALLRTALSSLVVLNFGQCRSVSRHCATTPRCKRIRRRHVRGRPGPTATASNRIAPPQFEAKITCGVQFGSPGSRRSDCSRSIGTVFTCAGMRDWHGHLVTRFGVRYTLPKDALSKPAPSTPLSASTCIRTCCKRRPIW